MTTRMLIDARHREETRVAVTKGNRIEEFDFESAEHKQLKGNIYLAKVTRVEPSLQAAFVEYGGNRHGFLAFSEIHPDYYQIPKEDREALLREEAEHAAEAAMRAEEDLEDLEGDVADVEGFDDDNDDHPHAPQLVDNDGGDDDDDDHRGDDENGDSDQNGDDSDSDDDDRENGDGENGDSNGRARGHNKGRRGRARGRGRRDDQDGENRMSLRRRYKIQDVIRRRQVMLVQVVKEERGNKGAALTTYLSLAGRYCVLMPNTMHGGGISRKISNGADRRKLKAIIDEMDLPPSMGCIVRTAGMSRTKVEIKRDFDYLARLWDEIRERTLHSSAPALIHTDSDLIKRAIRDIYHKDIDEVLVEGEDGYRAAKQFMRLLMPTHARRVKQYADPISLYQRCGVEDQLNGMLNPVVQLKSGGYLVINPTEALVSIDINSGRSTREHNIEQTALSTNLEAAHEIARQLRLRDMAGLIVIDFIDMDHSSNVRKVERAMKDALKNDRARIQIGRISGFGLMEMSRQRLRTGVLEASTRACPHCDGIGLVRTASSAGLSALRLIEEEAARGRGSKILLRASQEATFYLLNEKRAELRAIEELYGVSVAILPDAETEGGRMAIEASGPPPLVRPTFAAVQILEDEEDDLYETEEEDAEPEEQPVAAAEGEGEAQPAEPAESAENSDSDDDSDGRKRRRRRRRGRRGRRDDGQAENGDQQADGDDSSVDSGDQGDADAETEGDDAADESSFTTEEEARPRRRRGGRGRRKADVSAENRDADAHDASPVEAEAGPSTADAEADSEQAPQAKAAARAAQAEPAAQSHEEEPSNEAATKSEASSAPIAEETAEPAAPAAEEEKPKRARAPRRTAKAKAAEEAETADEAGAEAEAKPAAKAKTTRARATTAKAGSTTKTAAAKAAAAAKVAADSPDAATADGEAEAPAPKKRAVTRKRKTVAEKAAEAAAAAEAATADGAEQPAAKAADAASGEDAAAEKPAAKPAVRRTRAKRATAASAPAANTTGAKDAAASVASDAAAADAAPAAPTPAPVAKAAEPDPAEQQDAGDSGTPRRGWWQRTFGE